MSQEKSTTSLRKRAEAQVHAAPAAKPLEGERLLHELQVHQVELQLQNEQLTETCLELAMLRDRYQTLYDCAPAAYFTLSAEGRLLELNRAAARMLEVSHDGPIGRPLSAYLRVDSREQFAHFIARAIAGTEQIEESLVLQTDAGPAIYVRAQAQRSSNEAGRPVVHLVLIDVSALRKAQEDLQHSFETFFKYWRP